MSALRSARLAGVWYPRDPAEIGAFLSEAPVEPTAVAALCPHAGWTYAGHVAGAVYARLPAADTFVLVGVNHYGDGHPRSLYPPGAWETPAGPLQVDAGFADRLIKICPGLEVNLTAHQKEHSLEVQAPFIARRFPKARIVPILLYDQSAATCHALGEALAELTAAADQRVFLIASSDMSHVGVEYEQPPPAGLTADAFARAQDALALEKILALDADGLLAVVQRRSITMCGAGPTAAIMYAARRLGARRAQKVAYATSSDVSGDAATAVGYAGLLFVV